MIGKDISQLFGQEERHSYQPNILDIKLYNLNTDHLFFKMKDTINLFLIFTKDNVIIALWNFGSLQYFKIIIININYSCTIYSVGKKDIYVQQISTENLLKAIGEDNADKDRHQNLESSMVYKQGIGNYNTEL